MLFLEIVLQIAAICVGISAIYNKKISKQGYKQENFILLALAIFFSKDSQFEIVQWLVFIVAIIILIIIGDKLLSIVKNKR